MPTSPTAISCTGRTIYLDYNADHTFAGDHAYFFLDTSHDTAHTSTYRHTGRHYLAIYFDSQY